MFIYPTLDVFSYDIRESLGQSEAEVKENRQRFKNRLPKELWDTLDQFDTLGQQKVELLGKERFHPFRDAVYEGYYYPVRLNDSYGLLLDCSCQEPQSSDHLEWISGLKQAIEQRSAQKPTLGQTWVFYASVSDVPLENYDALAQQCYQALVPTADWYHAKTGSSEFRGGKLFELWQEIDEMSHVIIILFSSQEIAAELTQPLIQDELRWFWYRHKITWAYAQSQHLKGALKSIEIDDLLDKFSNFSKNPKSTEVSEILWKANTLFRSYLELLTGLASQVPTIETNLLNYRKLTEKLAQRLPGLMIPNEFEQRTTEKYLRQIQRDEATFTVQLDLIKNIVASVQAQGVHNSVKQIADVQRKVEWLEVFFVSFYAAEFTHILVELLHKEGSSGIWAILIAAGLAGFTAFVGLKLYKHLKIDKHLAMVLGLIFLGVLIVSGFLIC